MRWLIDEKVHGLISTLRGSIHQSLPVVYLRFKVFSHWLIMFRQPYLRILYLRIREGPIILVTLGGNGRLGSRLARNRRRGAAHLFPSGMSREMDYEGNVVG